MNLTLTHSLAHDSRTNLETWLEEAETLARNLCPQHDPTGALTLVVDRPRQQHRHAQNVEVAGYEVPLVAGPDPAGPISRRLCPWPAKFGRFFYQSLAGCSPSLAGSLHRL